MNQHKLMTDYWHNMVTGKMKYYFFPAKANIKEGNITISSENEVMGTAHIKPIANTKYDDISKLDIDQETIDDLKHNYLNVWILEISKDLGFPFYDHEYGSSEKALEAAKKAAGDLKITRGKEMVIVEISDVVPFVEETISSENELLLFGKGR